MKIGNGVQRGGKITAAGGITLFGGPHADGAAGIENQNFFHGIPLFSLKSHFILAWLRPLVKE